MQIRIKANNHELTASTLRRIKSRFPDFVQANQKLNEPLQAAVYYGMVTDNFGKRVRAVNEFEVTTKSELDEMLAVFASKAEAEAITKGKLA